MERLKFLVIAAFLLMPSCALQKRIFRSHKGTIEIGNGILVISCKNPKNTISEIFPSHNETISSEKVAISLCKMPDNPLIEVFEELKINTTSIKTLSLNYVDIGNANFTEGLMIKNLELQTKPKLFALEKMFEHLTQLKNLTITGAELPTLPMTLEVLWINSNAAITSWDGCSNLQELNIWKVQNKKQLPEKWPQECTRLKSINLSEMSEEATKSVIDSIVAGSPNLQSLAIQSCKLHNVPFEILPKSITELDLQNNHIAGMNRDQASQLFSTRARKIWLTGNPIACSCENNRLLEALHMNQSQVADYGALRCADNEYRVRSVSVPELCRFVVMSNWEYGLGYVWGLCCSLSVLSVVLLIAVRRYGYTVRTILYSRGFCVSCLKDGIDSDRPYDAFLSFAHGDDKFVLEDLLPRLEDPPNDFRVCMHYRDWAVGEWIPAQIMQSVRQSKRTIIVLSKNFVKSWWGVLEFRYAHASAMAEGRSRLLVLILDDVLNEKLAPELQGYLEYHTFLRCNDPFFWDKLRYAMPHRDNTPEDII